MSGLSPVGGEGEGIVLFDDTNERVEEFLHAPGAVPADEIGRNFVVDEEAEHGRMTGVGQRGLGDIGADGFDGLGLVEEEDALVPRDGDHDAEAEFLGEIEEPAGRRVVDAQDIDAEVAHEAEVDGDFFRRGKIGAAFGVGAEGAVGDALEIELVFALEEKLGPDLQAGEIGRGYGRRGNNVMHGAQFRLDGALRQDGMADFLPKDT
jgi:hypothetical protein